MVLSIPISAEVEAKLIAKSAAVGVDVGTFAAKPVERAATRTVLDELLAPLRDEFDQSEMTEDEPTENSKQEARTERRARRAF